MTDSGERVWRELVNLVKRIDGVRVRAGVFDGDYADIAMIHEYGAPGANIPQRSFIRSTFTARLVELATLQAKIAQAILAGKLDERQAMGLLGAWAAGAIKATITRDGHFAPLAPATIARKKSDKPLIETGELVNRITFVVVP